MDLPSAGASTPTAPLAEGASPAIAQWFTLKAENPDALLFLRMGDFYELFFADAEAAAGALDIALTKRGEHGGAPIPMCGVPVHAADAYLSRLIRRGFRVAVAEQMEPAKGRTGKGPLRRAVVRLVTPGTLTEDSLLEPHRPNLLLALARVGPGLGAAWLDVSTGLFETEALAPAGLAALLGRLEPAEILAPEGLPLGDWSNRRGPDTAPSAPAAAARQVAAAFGAASLDAFGTFSDAEAVAAATALAYVQAAGAGTMPRLSRPQPAGLAGQMMLDAATRASLEITRARDGGTAHTLLAAVSRTLTAPGARLLAAWLGGPLLDPAAIARRQDGWCWLLTQPGALAALRTALRGVPDLARALGRLSSGRGAPRDMAAVAVAMSSAREAAAALDGAPWGLAALRVDPALADLLARALVPSPPARLEDGGMIAPGFDGELDAQRALRDDSRRVVSGLTAGPGAAVWRGVAEDQAPPATGVCDRGAGRGRREAAGASGADDAPGDDQRRPVRECGAGRPGPAHQPGRRCGCGAGAAGVGQHGWGGAVPRRRVGGLRLGPGPAGRAAILCTAGRGRAVVPSACHGRRRVLHPGGPASRGGGRAGRGRRLCAQRLRPVACPARAAAHGSEHGGQEHLPAAERADRRACAGRAAGAGGVCGHRRRGPGVQPGSAPRTTWRAGAAPSWWR